MHNLSVGVFDQLDTTSPMDMDKMVAYNQRILRGAALKKYIEVLVTCRQLARELAVYEWNLCKVAGLSAEDFWNWDNTDTMEYDGHIFLARDKFIDFERDLWFELGKCMWRKHRSIYQDNMKYICNSIVNPFKVKILRYAEHVRDIHDLAKYILPPLRKVKSAEADNLTVCNQEFKVSEIRLVIKYRLS